jgi:prephenate dehydrogenase
MMIERLTIIGVGLIGGSLAMALRQAGAVGEVVGVGRSVENLKLALERGIVDRYTQDPLEGVAGADVVFLSVPVEQIAPLAAQIRPALKAGCVVTDGGSTKRSITQETDAAYRLPQGSAAAPGDGPAFVAGHPIAGTEKSGAGAAFPELYHRKRTILTPGAETPAWSVDRVKQLWEAAGAFVEVMSAEHHDAVLAAISHLPHAAAFALVNAVLRLEDQAGGPILPYAAGGFLDFTRIASSDPAMWRDIFLQNGDQLLRSIESYERELQALRAMIEARDAEGLAEYFAGAKAARDNLVRR